MEVKRRPLADYIEKVQKDVPVNMRGVLIDWLVEVSEEYNLLPESLYLTISYIDRYLSLNVLNRQRLQLLGVSSMLIASKYEEISPPHTEDFCDITDNTYTKQEVVKMEAEVLKTLKIEMGNPTVKTFLGRFIRIAQEDYDTPNLQLEFLSYYFAELSLLEYGCIKFLPSMIAASVTFHAKFMLKPKSHPWLSGYNYKEADGRVPETLHILLDGLFYLMRSEEQECVGCSGYKMI
ncbi:G2/mitotic-specific cyclin C13-1-like protein [Tanacetum coccineum]